MGIKSYIVNFLKFLKHGGVKYVSVTFTNPDARYTNKKVFISGGSEGLGRAMAKAYLAEGAEVIVTGRSKENCQTSSFPKVMPSFIRWYGTPWILTLISRSSIKPFP